MDPTRTEDVTANLPTGWARTTLGKILKPSTEKVDPSNIKETSYVGLEHIEKGTGRLLMRASSAEVKSTKSQFYAGDLLYGRLRPYLNKVFFADFQGICSTDILVFPKKNHLSNKFLALRLLSSDFVSYASRNVSGVQHPRVSFETLSHFPLSLPPFAEQRRIVAKIEELLTRIDAGVGYLKTLQAQLKSYRNSILTHASEGGLTAKWRRTQRSDTLPISVELPHVDSKDFPQLPVGWVWTTISQIGEVITGNTPAKSKSEYYGTDFLFYKPADLNDGFYVKKSVDGLSKLGILKAKLLPAGSTLVTCIGATIGKTGFIRTEGAINQQINGIIPNKLVLPEYVYFICISPHFQQIIKDSASSTTLPILNKTKFEHLHLPLPPLREQESIIKEIVFRFSSAAMSEEAISSCVKQAISLKQSVLKQAFAGKLVTQNPNDEPASAFLERLRAIKVPKQVKSEIFGEKTSLQTELHRYVK